MRHGSSYISLRQTLSQLGGALLVILLVTFIAFGLSYLSPTDAATSFFTANGIAPTAEQLAAKRAELGLDQPFLTQYFSWLGGLFQGDLGTSLRTGHPVSEVLARALPYTLFLTVVTMLITLAVSIPVGLLSAWYKGGLFDKIIRAITYLFNALPSFFIALMLLYVCSTQLHVIGVLSTRDFSGVLLPALSLALPLIAWFSRQVRAYALEQLACPYVAGLKSRGMSNKRILWVHVLRNLLAPLLALVGVSFGMLFGGSAIVECIFSWPGLGFESIEAVGHRDYAFIAAYALVMALMYLIVNALVDVVCHKVNPQLRSGGLHA